MQRIELDIPLAQQPDIEAQLFELGIHSISTTPDHDTRLIVLCDTTDAWPEDIYTYIHHQVDIPETDWVNQWIESYEGIHISDHLSIRPTNTTPPASDTGLIIWLDPKDAFGSGTHPTTHLCLDALDTYLRTIPSHQLQAMTMLDVGAGTGVLSILATKRGVGCVHAIDIEPDSVSQTIVNATLNNCTTITAEQGDILRWTSPPATYDIIIANVITNVLLETIPHLLNALRLHGRLILSGMLAQNMPIVANKLDQLGQSSTSITQDSWCALIVDLNK